MTILRFLLFPFALLYGLIIRVRHTLYDSKIFHSQQYSTPTICVGNVRVGGTGKTPMTEYLIRLLQKRYRVGVLSRGYKRKSKGLVIATALSTADQIGDEPYQFWNKYPTITLAVDANRRRGITALEALKNPPEVILLDDAMQHRKVTPRLTLVLTAYGQLYADDWLLPTGNLRDTTDRVAKTDAVVVTKCPDILTENERHNIRERLKKYPSQPVFFTKIVYSKTVYSTDNQELLTDFVKKTFVLVTGIANAHPLIAYLERENATFEHWEYGDHHDFTASEIQKIRQTKRVLTTEKDYMRLHSHAPEVFYLPITMEFLTKDEQTVFDEMMMDFIDEK